MSHPCAPAPATLDEETSTNRSGNPGFSAVLEARLSRRQVLLGGISAAALLAFDARASAALGGGGRKPRLGFQAVPKSLADTVTVPPGYTSTVLYALGDPLNLQTPAWAGDGSETGASYTSRAGDHHDGIHYFGLGADNRPDPSNSHRGLLAMNHENITTAFLHPRGATVDASGRRLVADEVVKEMNAHGVSVVEVARGTDAGKPFQVNRASPFNRRITACTEMVLSGPAAASPALRTQFSPDGTRTRGTVNNCANGYTPWGTYLTCEENWAGLFRRDAGDNARRSAAEAAALERYSLADGATGHHGWSTVEASSPGDTTYARWNLTADPKAPADGSGDFRNAANTFGWVVEIDPFDPASTPRKRTALGRFAHEGAWPARVEPGQPVVFYMGDDSRGEYIYKFVSSVPYNPLDRGPTAGDKYLDQGTLYVARFDADGRGQWLDLKFGLDGVDKNNPAYSFSSQADVLIHARLAADARGATRMDRPEWCAVNRVNGEVYFTLTNHSGRGVGQGPPVDAANPRSYSDLKGGAAQHGNVNGHIIRWREANDDPASTRFTWDVYLFGAQADADRASVNLSALTDVNDFSSPDGLWFSRAENEGRGLLWIETDDGAYTDVSNCMLLAAVPGQVGDGGARMVGTQRTFAGAPATDDTVRRFLVGPRGCELTGLDSTPDGRALFVNIQHPGENTPAGQIGNPAAYESHWPGGGLTRPRSATLVITRDDGGVVGI